MNRLFSGVSLAAFQAAPTIVPSAAAPAFLMNAGEFRPLPPMIGALMPSWRAWVAICAPSASAETITASGLVPLISVNCAEKSVSVVA